MYGNSIQNAIHFHALISEFYNLAPLSVQLHEYHNAKKDQNEVFGHLRCWVGSIGLILHRERKSIIYYLWVIFSSWNYQFGYFGASNIGRGVITRRWPGSCSYSIRYNELKNVNKSASLSVSRLST